jgi:hypothetical protein
MRRINKHLWHKSDNIIVPVTIVAMSYYCVSEAPLSSLYTHMLLKTFIKIQHFYSIHKQSENSATVSDTHEANRQIIIESVHSIY